MSSRAEARSLKGMIRPLFVISYVAPPFLSLYWGGSSHALGKVPA